MINYFYILVFAVIAGAISVALLVLPFIINNLPRILDEKKADHNQNTPYECGFDPQEKKIKRFNVKFCLIAILFLIFDLEVSFLFPWAVAFKDLTIFGFFSMMFFIAILAVGFIYELKKGALDWS